MTPSNPTGGSFEAFKDSFSYGTRTDLTFKFLKRLPSEDAARFLQELLSKLGESCDDGRYERLVDHVYEWQRRAYSENAGSGKLPWVYDEGPFASLTKPVSASRLVLLTSSGHFVDGDDPQPFGIEHMTQDEAIRRIDEFVKAAPVLSAVPIDTPRDRLRVRHGGYDIRGAEADPDVCLSADGVEAARVAMADPGTVAGRFDVAYASSTWPYPWIARLGNLRSRLTKISTGDQAIFVRRAAFEAVGGYPEIPLMEDVELSRRLRRLGGMACLRIQVLGSTRKWRREGVWRTVTLMWLLRALHGLGVPPARLHRLYYRRDPGKRVPPDPGP